MDGVGRGCNKTQTQVEFVIPCHTILVIVVGFKHQIGKQCHVVVTTLIPILREVVLGKLKRKLSTRFPEVGLDNLDVHIHTVHHICHIFDFFHLIIDRSKVFCFRPCHIHRRNSRHRSDLCIRIVEQTRTLGISVHEYIVNGSIETLVLCYHIRCLHRRVQSWQRIIQFEFSIQCRTIKHARSKQFVEIGRHPFT